MQTACLRRRPAASAAYSQLAEDGYCVLPGIVPGEQIAGLAAELQPLFARTPFSQGYFNGFRTRRFHGLLKRSRGAAALVLNPAVLAVAEEMLLPFCDMLQLNLTQAVEVHPGERLQVPHRDQDMWAGEKGRIEYIVNVMWPLGAFTPDNGGTRLWPGSHRRQDETALPEADAVSPELAPGDALMFLGSTLHGAGANRTLVPRRGIIVSYCLGWLKPYENMWLTYPPDVARAFPSELRDLVGYRRHRPNLGNYDGQCPSVLFDDDLPDLLPATDALAPEHQRRLEAFVSRQAGTSPTRGV
jgi:ectoine hydroxylase-related dioxygenase (phytanoyl-CoA dioxygenase family)